MPQELEHLLAVGLALDVRGDRGPVVVGDEGEQRLGERLAERGRGLPCAQLALEVAFERPRSPRTPGCHSISSSTSSKPE